MDCLANPYTLLLLLFSTLGMGQYSPTSLETNESGSINVGRAMETLQYHTLLEAVEAAELTELLDRNAAFTVFAPSDKAFERSSGTNLKALMKPENKQALRAMLTYHVIAGRHTAASILRAMCRGAGTASFTTVQGNEILASMEGTDITLMDCSGNIARITAADTNKGKGIVHVIDRVISPR